MGDFSYGNDHRLYYRLLKLYREGKLKRISQEEGGGELEGKFRIFPRIPEKYASDSFMLLRLGFVGMLAYFTSEALNKGLAAMGASFTVHKLVVGNLKNKKQKHRGTAAKPVFTGFAAVLRSAAGNLEKRLWHTGKIYSIIITVQPCARIYDKERYKLACKSDLTYILA